MTYCSASLVILTFLNAGASDEYRAMVGWLLIGIAGLNIALNLVVVGYSLLDELYSDILGMYSRRR